MYNGGDDIGAVVADIGSSYSRLGYAGDDCPRAYIPSMIGTFEGSRETKDYQFNLSFRENMALESPLVDGLVHNWDMLERLWGHMMKEYVKVDSAEVPVLLAEKSYNTSYCRQRFCEMLFEEYRSPAMFLSKDAVLECYSVGKTTGLVVDVGGSGTVITPVLDGWAEARAINRAPVGGRFMDSYMMTLLRKRQLQLQQQQQQQQPSFNLVPAFRIAKTVMGDKVTSVALADLKSVHPSYDAYMSLELGKDVKEFVCRMADTTVSEFDPRFCNLPAQQYELPDGSIVDVGVERFLVPELLCDFSGVDLRPTDLTAIGLGPANPAADSASSASAGSVSSSASRSVPRLALDSVLRCDADTHSSLLSSLVVAGGGSSPEGVPDRLRAEIEQLLHSNGGGGSGANAWKVKMTAAGNNERPLSCWLGGSILASLGSFHEMWMTKAEYSEFGSSLIDKKCP